MLNSVGKNFRMYCRLRGWTRDEVAKRMKVSKPVITWIWQGYRISENTKTLLEEVTHIPMRTWERKLGIKELKELIEVVSNEWGNE